MSLHIVDPNDPEDAAFMAFIEAAISGRPVVCPEHGTPVQVIPVEIDLGVLTVPAPRPAHPWFLGVI